MADYSGGPSYHEIMAAEKAKEFNKKNVLDALYAEYGQMVVKAERTSHNTRMTYHDKADGILIAIKIVEKM